MELAILGIQLPFVPGNFRESVCIEIRDNEAIRTWIGPYAQHQRVPHCSGRDYDWQLKKNTEFGKK